MGVVLLIFGVQIQVNTMRRPTLILLLSIFKESVSVAGAVLLICHKSGLMTLILYLVSIPVLLFMMLRIVWIVER